MKQNKLIWVTKIFLAILFLISYQTSAFAETTPAGQAILVNGRLTAAQPNQTPRLLQRGSTFYSGDTISSTGPSQLRFTDGTLVALQPQSVMRVDDYQFQLSRDNAGGVQFGAMKYAVSLIAGGFRTITGAIGKYNPSDYNVTTTVATIGVRGTDYSIAYSKGGQGGGGSGGGKCTLAAALQQGSIAIKNAGGILILGKGQQYQYACVESEYTAPQGESAIPQVFLTSPKMTNTSVHKGGICLQ